MVKPARTGAAIPGNPPGGRRLGWKVPLGVAAITLLTAFWLASHFFSDSGRLGRSPETNSSHAASASYGGSSSCRECHQEQYALWQGSHHGMAERPLRPDVDRSAFSPPRAVADGGQTYFVSWSNSLPEVSCTGTSTTPAKFKLERVIGEAPLRQFLVSFADGRYQAWDEAYDPGSNQWFNVFGTEQRRPGEWGHWTGRGMNWNSMCASCHNTALRRNYNESTDSYHTTMAEPGVGCEACHGPLQAHNRWQQQFGNSSAKDPTLPHLDHQQALDNCGYCHARRTELTAGFNPGDNFFDDCQLVIPDATARYFADGQVHEEDYEYGSFLGSRMAARGVRCVDCHNPHSMKPLLPGNFLCLRCHAGGNPNAPVINPVTHSHHKVFGFGTNAQPVAVDLSSYNPKTVQETGGECVNCHMPQTVYMQRHWRHDHGFTIPDPLLTKQFGIPNACNRCHRDKDSDWALNYCNDWYGSKMERPTRARAQVIAAAQAGDPASRPGLLDWLAKEELPYWRAVEAGLLEPWVERAEVGSALERCLADTNALVRTVAAGALGRAVQAGAQGAIDALQPILADPRRSVRIAAATALGSALDQSCVAAADYAQFLKLSADQPVGQLQAGVVAFARNDLPGAFAHLRKAVAWDPYSAPLREELAVVLSAMNQPQEALAQLREACRLAPQDAECHYKLALAYNEAGDSAQTVSELNRAVELAPHYARAWYNLGLAQNALGQTGEAIESLVRAETAAPEDPRIPYARATILARLGRTAEAAAAARRALELRPGYPEAQELLNALGR